jgi:F0F1-type ATP synthase assembly protein I
LTLSISAVVLLGALVYLLWRFAGLRSWQALVCILFGFYLASSSLAPYIRSACQAAARYLAGVDL